MVIVFVLSNSLGSQVAAALHVVMVYIWCGMIYTIWVPQIKILNHESVSFYVSYLRILQLMPTTHVSYFSRRVTSFFHYILVLCILLTDLDPKNLNILYARMSKIIDCLHPTYYYCHASNFVVKLVVWHNQHVFCCVYRDLISVSRSWMISRETSFSCLCSLMGNLHGWHMQPFHFFIFLCPMSSKNSHLYNQQTLFIQLKLSTRFEFLSLDVVIDH